MAPRKGRDVAAIRWDRLDEKGFNDLVEALVVRARTGGGLVANAIDGRGGDKGIDIDVRVEKTGQLVEVLQLKYFPGGFSGGFRQRREQIKASFEKAMEESPDVWTLVFPGNPTLAERKSVYALAGGHKVRIRIMGVAELNGLLADNPEIADYFGREAAIDVLREINRPEAALAKPGDLRAEVARLGNRLDGRSQYWGTAFHLEPDGTYVESYFAKREDAADREPLSISLQTKFGPDHGELRAKFDDRMKYGGSGTVVLPPEVVVEVRRDGPEWFAGTFSGGEVHLTTETPRKAIPVRVAVRTADGELAEAAGTTTIIDQGYGGGSVEIQLEGGLEMRWRFPTEYADGGSVSLTFDPTGASAREVRRVLRFNAMLKKGAEVELTISGNPPLKVALAEEPAFGPSDALLELVDDLCELEDYFDVALRFPPEEVDSSDRVWARVLVRMIHGQPTPMPFVDSFNGTLNGLPSEGLTGLLTKGGAVCISQQEWGVELFGAPLRPGVVYIYSHHVQADDAEELAAALEAGTAADMKLVVRPIDGGPFLIYLPEAVSKRGDDPVKAHPWGLTGITEHSKFSDLPNAAGAPFSGMGADAEEAAPEL
jgi:hypothetical protein